MVSGSNPSGLDLDENSLGLTPEGKAQVLRPSDTIIGDFESDLGSWSKSIDDGVIQVDNTFSKRGDNSVYFKVNGTSDKEVNNKITNTYDLTGVSDLKVNVYLERNDSDTQFIVNVDGNQEIKKDSENLNTSEWYKFVVDVSSYSGETPIEVIGRDEFSLASTLEFYLDQIVLTFDPNKAVDGGAGN